MILKFYENSVLFAHLMSEKQKKMTTRTFFAVSSFLLLLFITKRTHIFQAQPEEGTDFTFTVN